MESENEATPSNVLCMEDPGSSNKKTKRTDSERSKERREKRKLDPVLLEADRLDGAARQRKRRQILKDQAQGSSQQQQQQNTVITIPVTSNTIQIPANFAGQSVQVGPSIQFPMPILPAQMIPVQVPITTGNGQTFFQAVHVPIQNFGYQMPQMQIFPQFTQQFTPITITNAQGQQMTVIPAQQMRPNQNIIQIPNIPGLQSIPSQIQHIPEIGNVQVISANALNGNFMSQPIQTIQQIPQSPVIQAQTSQQQTTTSSAQPSTPVSSQPSQSQTISITPQTISQLKSPEQETSTKWIVKPEIVQSSSVMMQTSSAPPFFPDIEMNDNQAGSDSSEEENFKGFAQESIESQRYLVEILRTWHKALTFEQIIEAPSSDEENHPVNEHPGEWKCPRCFMSFSSKKTFRQHLTPRIRNLSACENRMQQWERYRRGVEILRRFPNATYGLDKFTEVAQFMLVRDNSTWVNGHLLQDIDMPEDTARMHARQAMHLMFGIDAPEGHSTSHLCGIFRCVALQHLWHEPILLNLAREWCHELQRRGFFDEAAEHPCIGHGPGQRMCMWCTNAQ